MATENSSPPAPKPSLSSAVKVRKTPVKAGPLPEVPEVKVITPMGWMHTARFLITAAEAALTEGFLTLAGGIGASLGADGGLFSVAIGVKLEGRQKWR